MKTIKLANGNTYAVEWCGISDLSGHLFMELSPTEKTMTAVIADFDDTTATDTIVYTLGTEVMVHKGYTALTSINKKSDGVLRIELAKPAQ